MYLSGMVIAQSGSWLTWATIKICTRSMPRDRQMVSSAGEKVANTRTSVGTQMWASSASAGDSPGIGNGVPRAALESNDEAQS